MLHFGVYCWMDLATFLLTTVVVKEILKINTTKLLMANHKTVFTGS